LGAEEKLPQLLAESWCILVEEPGQLDLYGLDVGLSKQCMSAIEQMTKTSETYISGTLDKVVDELNDDIVFVLENLGDLFGYPSAREGVVS
jgi:hypothetical protein